MDTRQNPGKNQQLAKWENNINRYREGYLDHAKDPGKENIIIDAQKHTASSIDKYYDKQY